MKLLVSFSKLDSFPSHVMFELRIYFLLLYAPQNLLGCVDDTDTYTTETDTSCQKKKKSPFLQLLVLIQIGFLVLIY